MKVKSLVKVRKQIDGSCVVGFFALAVLLTLLVISPPAWSGGGGSSLKSNAVKFEAIPGSEIKRVILTAKAAQRLGIETGEVSEQQINRTQMVGGRVIRHDQVRQPTKKARGKFASLGKFTVASTQKDIVSDEATGQQETGVATESGDDSDSEWVEVTVSEGEWKRMVKDEPARIMPLFTRDELQVEVLALPSGKEPVEDSKRSMMKLYYRLPGKDHGLTLYHRVRVELPVAGSDDKQLVVPYSAVYYDASGGGWVYVSPGPLVYERQRIVIERIEDDLAVLAAGPPPGTQVVTVGVPLLYGAEVVFGK